MEMRKEKLSDVEHTPLALRISGGPSGLASVLTSEITLVTPHALLICHGCRNPHTSSDDCIEFCNSFSAFAAKTDQGKASRRQAWMIAEPNGNGLCSLAEIDGLDSSCGSSPAIVVNLLVVCCNEDTSSACGNNFASSIDTSISNGVNPRLVKFYR
jgi:hypothetical protein